MPASAHNSLTVTSHEKPPAAARAFSTTRQRLFFLPLHVRDPVALAQYLELRFGQELLHSGLRKGMLQVPHLATQRFDFLFLVGDLHTHHLAQEMIPAQL
jgi:hypothetical protein